MYEIINVFNAKKAPAFELNPNGSKPRNGYSPKNSKQGCDKIRFPFQKNHIFTNISLS